MKRRDNEEPLAGVIKRLLKAYRLEEGYYAAAVTTYWEQLMGTAVARRTGKMELKKGTLYIEITSAPLRQELSFGKDKIVAKLNRKLGATVIDELKIVG